jgi:hypothetical protein
MNNEPSEKLPAPSAPLAAEERPHHPFSPSTLQYREACSAWTPRVAKVLHSRTIAGTRSHNVVDSGEDDPLLSDEDATAAAECLDFVDQRRRLMEAEAAEVQAAAGAVADLAGQPEDRGAFQVTELKEVHLAVDDLVFPDGTKHTTAGYVDRALINYNKTYAELFDWKFGMWIVEEASNNTQGIAYVLGLFKMYPTLSSVRFFFKQPHLDHVSDHTFFRADVDKLYLRIQVIVNRAREGRARAEKDDWSMAQPHVPVCNFCGDLGKCKKVCGFACKVSHKFHALEFPENVDPAFVQKPEEMAKLLRMSQVLKVWCDSAKQWITNRIMRGEADMLAGYKLETRQGRREIVDPVVFKQVALRYMTEAQYSECLNASFGPLEDIITESAPRGQKTARVKEFDEALEQSGAVARKPSYSFLMPESKK